MMNRWLDRGVDGFRMDVISLHCKGTRSLPDGQGERVCVFAGAVRISAEAARLSAGNAQPRALMGETVCASGETTFVTHGERRVPLSATAGSWICCSSLTSWIMDGGDGQVGCTIPFDLMTIQAASSCAWQAAIGWNTLFWGNHDQPRAVVSRFGCDADRDAAKAGARTCLATAMYLLRGTPFLYQGEEIGMTNCPVPGHQTQLRDVESLNLLRQAAERRQDGLGMATASAAKAGTMRARPCSGMRRPMRGFTDGTPWIDGQSELRGKSMWLRRIRRPGLGAALITGALLALRRERDVLRYGDFSLLLHEHPQVFAYARTFEGQQIRIYCNFQTGMPRCRKPSVKRRCF